MEWARGCGGKRLASSANRYAVSATHSVGTDAGGGVACGVDNIAFGGGAIDGAFRSARGVGVNPGVRNAASRGARLIYWRS